MRRGEKDSFTPAKITFESSIGAIANKWDRCSPAYQYAIDLDNGGILWLVGEASRFDNTWRKDRSFADSWSQFRFESEKDYRITWPDYLWATFRRP